CRPCRAQGYGPPTGGPTRFPLGILAARDDVPRVSPFGPLAALEGRDGRLGDRVPGGGDGARRLAGPAGLGHGGGGGSPGTPARRERGPRPRRRLADRGEGAPYFVAALTAARTSFAESSWAFCSSSSAFLFASRPALFFSAHSRAAFSVPN